MRVEIANKILLTAVLVMILTCLVGLYGSLNKNDKMSDIAMKMLFVEVAITAIGFIIGIWIYL